MLTTPLLITSNILIRCSHTRPTHAQKKIGGKNACLGRWTSFPRVVVWTRSVVKILSSILEVITFWSVGQRYPVHSGSGPDLW